MFKSIKLKLKNYSKNGFTLAEVLITLGIIGVVAAMAMPMIVKKYQEQVYKTAYKKVYAELSEAVREAIFNQEFIRTSFFEKEATSNEFDIIKIDMSFIHQIGKSPKTEIILKSIISMAHQLGLKIVAEGVETQDQLQFLRENDCDFIQGFYFYKPMEEDAFAEILDMQ